MATFRIDQVTPGAGVAGRSRWDLVPDEIITLTATDPVGAGVSYGWEILDKAGSVAILSASSGISVTLGPNTAIDEPCSFRVRLTVDDNGTITTMTRSFGVLAPNSGLRLPMFGETAPASATLASNDPADSDDNALYTDRAGLGSSEQNWRGWAEWGYELTLAVENLATNASVTLAGDVTGLSGTTVVERIQSRDVLDAAPTDGQVLTWVAANNQWEPEDPPAGGYPVVALHEVVAGTNTIADTPDVPLVLGGFVLDPSAFDYSTLVFTFRMLGTMFSGGADGRIDLYDLGPPGAPIVPARRARLSIDPTDSGVPVELTQVLTLDAAPGVDVNEIRATASMYEVRLLLDAGSPGDLLHVLNAGVRVEGSLV
jgi:hypothetical protein